MGPLFYVAATEVGCMETLDARYIRGECLHDQYSKEGEGEIAMKTLP